MGLGYILRAMHNVITPSFARSFEVIRSNGKNMALTPKAIYYLLFNPLKGRSVNWLHFAIQV